ncbi:MAG: 3-oxoacyl-ACP reductase, partial [Candidatus Hodarchaeota archaeon]
NCIAPIALTRMKSPIVEDFMTPETVSPMVLFLASDKARNITGHIIGIHGYNLFEYQINYTKGIEKSAEDPWTADKIATNFDAITRMS